MQDAEKKKPVVLIIMDGVGIGDGGEGDAVAHANTPTLDRLNREATIRRHSLKLRTDGEFVSLPKGQMGNSEVGHLTIGAGRRLTQSLPRINATIEDGSLFRSAELLSTIARLKESDGTFHLFTLLSEGGVHSHMDHAIAMARFIASQNVKVAVHAASDGRDVKPQSVEEYLTKFFARTKDQPLISLATVSGRDYSMDRDFEWHKTQLAYQAIVFGDGPRSDDFIKDLPLEYQSQALRLKPGSEVTDQPILPTVVGSYAGMNANDAFLMMNFREDRASQMCQAIVDPASVGFEVKFLQNGKQQFSPANALGITDYSEELKPLMTTILPHEKIPNGLGEVLSANGLAQCRIAETEKFRHVTSFLNGRKQTPHENEDWILVPSPKGLKGYNEKPEMSSVEVTDKLIEALKSGKYDVIILNYAQGDMVGHTGDFGGAVKSVESVDNGLARAVPLIEEMGGTVIIIADHGNVEVMRDKDGGVNTKHTTNPVPFIIAGRSDYFIMSPRDGKEAGLGDIAPTILALCGIDKPLEMTGESLVTVLRREIPQPPSDRGLQA